MIIEVIIKVNGELETQRVAVGDKSDFQIHDLLQNTNWNLKHSFSQGANALARKMLIRPKTGVKTGIE